MRFHFPIIIIDEDFRSENASGLGIRALADAIEKEGLDVLGVTSYGDLTSFAQQQSRASAFILSIDDEEFTPGPELDPAVLNLRAFVEEIRHKNPDIPIFLHGETRTSRHIPNDILRELHGFIHMYEDTPEFIARHVVREARAYLDSLPPPFFRALTHYAADGSYSWHCPGHSGGVAFLKSPVGQMFHQFFGENMLRADVCNAVEELGQLLDHTGPVAASERNAARIFNADHLFFVTNGTSTSNKIVWHSTVAPGDIVIVDRNCHKSILHAIMMTGAIPVFLMPTRNNYGIIGPIPKEEFRWKNIQKKIAAHPFASQVKGKPRVLTITQSTYDGILYNVEDIKEELDGKIDTLHFDEAWLPHAAFHDFYGDYHAIGADRPRCKESMVFSTQSTHKLLAGLSQASQILVQDAENNKLDRDVFNEAYLMHTSTSPQYSIIASCDVAAAMMEEPGGTALVEESISRSAGFPPRHAQGGQGMGRRLVVPGLGAEGPLRGRHRGARGLDAQARRKLARLRQAGQGLQPARPDQGHHHHPGPRRRWRFLRRQRHSRRHRHQVPRRARRDRREVRPLFLLHHVHHRHHQGPLEHAGHRPAAVQGRLRPQPSAVEGAARIRRQASALRAGRPQGLVHPDPRGLQGARRRPPDHRRCTCPTWCRRCARPTPSPRWPTARSTACRSTSSKAASPRCC
jgi:hypothetical protein